MRALKWAMAAWCLLTVPAHAAAPAASGPASPQAARCTAGDAGRYEVTEFVDRTTLVSDGHLVKRIVTSSKETTASGNLTYNDLFFVVFDHAALPTLTITAADARLELGPSELDLNQLPWWLVEPIAPQQLGESTVYTLKIVGGPDCATGN
ncbi:hypothetical protein [Paraburkholderia sp. D1E]|uniref:hypothetical protein n=1 Tax=Paraburkholderia sp. D1E TaxID=3461398 RepID=UPI004045CF1D